MKREVCIFCAALALFVVLFLAGCASPVVPAPSASLPREQADRLAQQVARQIGGKSWSVRGGSMRPALTDNCIVVTESVDFAELRSGDIVVYADRLLRPTLHRLVELRALGWRVQGDDCAWADDELVTRNNFLGRQCAVFFTSIGAPMPTENHESQ